MRSPIRVTRAPPGGAPAARTAAGGRGWCRSWARGRDGAGDAMTAAQSRTLGAFALPEDFPVAEFDATNTRVSEYRPDDKTLWHAFSGAWNAIAYRLRAAREHAASF